MSIGNDIGWGLAWNDHAPTVDQFELIAEQVTVTVLTGQAGIIRFEQSRDAEPNEIRAAPKRLMNDRLHGLVADQLRLNPDRVDERFTDMAQRASKEPRRRQFASRAGVE